MNDQSRYTTGGCDRFHMDNTRQGGGHALGWTIAGILAAFLVALALTGCRSTSYGPFTCRELGTDKSIAHCEWFKMTVDTNGTKTIEALGLDGFNASSSNGMFTLGGMARALFYTVGGIAIGSPQTTEQGAKDGLLALGGGKTAEDIGKWLLGLWQKSPPTNAPALAATNAPPAPSVPAPASGSAASQPADPCSPERANYNGSIHEVVVDRIDGKNDIRCLLNWDRPRGETFYMSEEQVRKAIHFDGNTLTVTCIELAPGVMAHYLGFCQPSSESPLVTGNPVQVGSGTLRPVFETRKPSPTASEAR